ncbi:cyclic nucleotide-gated ion channel 1-like isoform X2 [Cucumis melo var. makuwa]|uniref:Cyclic nucleotide-gated ion channel 1-like isoform X2 n=1 Tax=Cucumis melo var. makuwa TaxID=1194695 RepID=A0A5D3CAZ1_CUCMM|nr:cyclic nucleotide-gated ion channel 1-like isoform X2 [Cucumis melo var. makuwa]
MRKATKRSKHFPKPTAVEKHIVESGKPQPATATTTLQVSRFVAHILPALNQRRKKGKGSNDEVGPSNINGLHQSNV